MTTIIDRPFNALNEPIVPGGPMSGLPMLAPAATATINVDGAAPRSPSGVFRGALLAGSDDLTGCFSYDTFHANYRTAYVSYWIKYSANWYGHPAGTNKEMYYWTNSDIPSVFFSAQGAGMGELTPELDPQYLIVGYGSGHWTPNLVPSARIVRAKWAHIEIILVGNTAGTPDGSADFYLDGVHIGSYPGIQWRAAAAFWNYFRLNSFWGGNSGAFVPATMWFDVDHLYVSGKN
jgi:hypothetical protein